MSEANKALARQLWDVWHSRDLDKLGDIIAEGHVNHDPNNAADLVGVEGYRELITLYTTMFSNLRFEIHNIVAEGDIVCSRWTSADPRRRGPRDNTDRPLVEADRDELATHRERQVC